MVMLLTHPASTANVAGRPGTTPCQRQGMAPLPATTIASTQYGAEGSTHSIMLTALFVRVG